MDGTCKLPFWEAHPHLNPLSHTPLGHWGNSICFHCCPMLFQVRLSSKKPQCLNPQSPHTPLNPCKTADQRIPIEFWGKPLIPFLPPDRCWRSPPSKKIRGELCFPWLQNSLCLISHRSITLLPCSYSLEACLFLNIRYKIPKKTIRTQTVIPLAIPMTKLLDSEGSKKATAC